LELLSQLAVRRYELPFIDFDKAWFVILEYPKKNESELLPEVHKYHSDLQILLSDTTKAFYLFILNTIHITNIEDSQSSPVRKLVVKIHNYLWATL
jgi:biofilm protein TabA